MLSEATFRTRLGRPAAGGHLATFGQLLATSIATMAGLPRTCNYPDTPLRAYTGSVLGKAQGGLFTPRPQDKQRVRATIGH